MPSQGRRRYAVIGTGSRSRMYLAALQSSHADVGELVALCDPNPARMDYYRRELSLDAIPTYAPENLDRLFAETSPDCLIVTSPDYTHDVYVCAALDRGLDVVTEKPMTMDDQRLHRILHSLNESKGDLTVTFNYRYSPRNSVVKQVLASGAIGEITSVHFEWLLDTSHGADYFRRWHREKANSGGLLVHKSTHHFDLVNWWLDDVPTRVYARGGLKFYGAENAERRGLGPRPKLSRDQPAGSDPFRLDLAADPLLKGLYLDAEYADGYQRDKDVFDSGITIEDSLSLLVDYARGTTMTYSLTAYSPWEGYRVGFNGTEGRLELEVTERGWVRSAADQHDGKSVVDPSAVHDADVAADAIRPVGERVVLQRHWQRAEEIAIPTGEGGHGGGDAMLLDDVFRGGGEDPLGRTAGYLDGVRSVIVGISGNASLREGRPVDTAEFGLDLQPAEDTGARTGRSRRPMRVAVSGGSGRLGRSVVAGLAEAGHEVLSLDRIAGPAISGVAQRSVDLADAIATDAVFATLRPEAVVHLAAIATPFSAPEPVIWDTNTAIAFHVMQSAISHGATRVLAASSPTPLGYGNPQGWLPDYLPIDERHPLRPWNAYALSKVTIESIVAMFAAQQGRAVRLGSFRPCFVISPDEWQGAPTQQGHTVADRLADPGLAAVSLFNYVDARDAADFVDTWLRAAGDVPSGETFFVGAADALATRPLAELVPQFLPGTDELAAGLVGTAPAFSIAKAGSVLGWRPSRSWRTELAQSDQRGPIPDPSIPVGA